MASSDRAILIAGGGIGGLTTALALGQRGWPVRVLEETPEFGAIGYGIQLGPNAFHMFERLGLSEQVLRVCDLPPAVVMLDARDGAEVVRIPAGAALLQRFTHPYVVLHRVDLHRVLLDACRALPNIVLDGSSAVRRFADTGDGVRVETADGRTVDGAALIGADGLGSVVRAALVEEGPPCFIGYVAHRTIVPMAAVPEAVPRREVVLWGGPGLHIVHYPLRQGTLFNIVAVFQTPTYAGKGDADSHRAEVERTYRDMHPTMHALLAMMDLRRRWAISDRDPIRHWIRGRAVLLGDAAHPALQSFAQGACMAIEDGVCLGELIDQAGGDVTLAYPRYVQARLMRTARLQLESRALWPFYHTGGLARDVRNHTAATWSDDDVFRCLAWLWDGFPFPSAS